MIGEPNPVNGSQHSKKRYSWAAWGDINAFFGLMLDNLAVMVMLTVLLTPTNPNEPQQPGNYKFTSGFVVTHMIPGTAIGVLLGDLVYTWMAFRLARKSGRTDVTAMPLGLDTPSTFGIPFLVILPALNEYIKGMKGELTAEAYEEAMRFAWHVGLTVLVLVGLFKVAFTPFGNAIRRWIPRAGLLGSLAAIALALIAFLPLLEYIAPVPLVGMLSLTIILITLVAHRRLPGNFPGALAAVVIGIAAYLVFERLGNVLGWPLVPPRPQEGSAALHIPQLVPFIGGEHEGWNWWLRVLEVALAKLPVALPFALATIVGGIDCTESAAAAGDEFDTRTVLLTEGVASLVAGLFGGVLQTTPYIGQPAYKAMGGRAAYTLATAFFIGAVGLFGWFGLLYEWLPQAVMFPILVFVGLEITAQSFRATPEKHYPALALATLPALGAVVLIPMENALGLQKPSDKFVEVAQALRCLANGFIITSLLWGAGLAAILDGRLRRSALYFLTAGLFALFGIIHSPFPSAPIALPGQVLDELRAQPVARGHSHVVAEAVAAQALAPAGMPMVPQLGIIASAKVAELDEFALPIKPGVLVQMPYQWAGAYGLVATLLFGLSCFPASGRMETGTVPPGKES